MSSFTGLNTYDDVVIFLECLKDVFYNEFYVPYAPKMDKKKFLEYVSNIMAKISQKMDLYLINQMLDELTVRIDVDFVRRHQDITYKNQESGAASFKNTKEFLETSEKFAKLAATERGGAYDYTRDNVMLAATTSIFGGISTIIVYESAIVIIFIVILLIVLLYLYEKSIFKQNKSTMESIKFVKNMEKISMYGM